MFNSDIYDLCDIEEKAKDYLRNKNIKEIKVDLKSSE